jgi:all-trans-retinol 13,14-reductase
MQDGDTNTFDVIVIGSGMGGLSCAAALTRAGRRVLVLEQHFAPGGLTQTFTRGKFHWDVGVHYLGKMGEGGEARRVIDWLSGGALKFAPLGPVYDIVHLPDGLRLEFARPEASLVTELTERFPESRAQIAAFFDALHSAERALQALFILRVVPRWVAPLVRLLKGRAIRKWCGRTTLEVLTGIISDPRLRAVLAAQRGDYGPDPRESSFAMHALVMRHYFDGAYYPVGGSKAFADTLVPVIESGGGSVRVRAQVTGILVEAGAVAGVRLKNGTELRCARVVSDAGAQVTVGRLLPETERAAPWAQEIAAMKPSACHIGLYLGLNGDIRANGASASNHWFYETTELGDSLWRDPYAQPRTPASFISFPSLKDPLRANSHDAHTAEMVVFTDWALFAPWEATRIGRRPADYLEFKQKIEGRLLEQFQGYFPALAPLVEYCELSTPLSTVAFTGAEHGGIYGLETSPRRFLSTTLTPRTPVPGLYLTGQDVASPGITGAMMAGVMTAGAIEPRILRRL